MIKPTINEQDIIIAANNGNESFIKLIIQNILQAIGGDLTNQNIRTLNVDQITLIAWNYLQQEVDEGGYIQLIYNNYADFLFKNPFITVIDKWGVNSLAQQLRKAKKLYFKNKDSIQKDMSDADFMALYERFPAFDLLDDDFIANEDVWIMQIAQYVDNNLSLIHI